jgi:tRNA (adenine37-N6)-methyltransferase
VKDAGSAALSLQAIGVIHTPHATRVDAPRQSAAASDTTGVIELFEGRNLEHAIEDIAQWERLWVIYWFHLNTGWRPKVLPPRSTTGRKGVLATRSPHRPNPIGLSCVQLERVDGMKLHVRGVDMIDGTPVLDIKPYVAYTDAFPDAADGWLAERDPLPAYTVVFSELAARQLEWIGQRSPLPLRERIEKTLLLGPQPHPYLRIKPVEQGYVLAVKDWRAAFTLEDRLVTVTRISTGYRASQLAGRELDEVLELHRAFAAGLGNSEFP